MTDTKAYKYKQKTGTKIDNIPSKGMAFIDFIIFRCVVDVYDQTGTI